jgi:hypothetical protein
MLDSTWQGRILNQFHVIDVADRQGTNDTLRGNVQSWAYTYIGGWKASAEASSGISHINNFGTHDHPDEIAQALQEALEARLTAGEYLPWGEIELAYPPIKFAPDATIKDALVHLQKVIPLTIIGDPPILLPQKSNGK